MFKVWSVEDVKRAAHFPLFRGQSQRMVLVNKKKESDFKGCKSICRMGFESLSVEGKCVYNN